MTYTDPADSVGAPVPRLEVTHTSKTFGAYKALDDVSLRINPGEIHCLVGQNGSGKSTLVKILSGYQAPDRGAEMSIDGTQLPLPAQPSALRSAGFAVVHQDLGLAAEYSVIENVCIGTHHQRSWSRAIRRSAEREAVKTALDRLGQDIDVNALVGQLSTTDRVSVAIARAMLSQQPGRGLVMFDESTRALPPTELMHFHDLVRAIADEGGAALLISHNLEEVLTFADRLSVLRDGRLVAKAVAVDELSERELIRLMLGRDMPPPLNRSARRLRSESEVSERAVVRARALDGETIDRVDLDVFSGEILGVVGRVGAGYDELPYLLAGARPPGSRRGGTVQLGSASLDLSRDGVAQALAAGIALVPEDRARDGVAMALSVQDNLTLPQVAERSSRLYLAKDWQRAIVDRVIAELGVQPPNPAAQLRTLSGGNQQKVVVGKWLLTEPRLLILHEPTQGVDVGARADILAAVRQVADLGAAVLFAGSDASEIAMTCDRVIVVSDGRIVQTLRAPFTTDDILEAVYPATAKAS